MKKVTLLCSALALPFLAMAQSDSLISLKGNDLDASVKLFFWPVLGVEA